jgi:hypothetical protein
MATSAVADRRASPRAPYVVGRVRLSARRCPLCSATTASNHAARRRCRTSPILEQSCLPVSAVLGELDIAVLYQLQRRRSSFCTARCRPAQGFDASASESWARRGARAMPIAVSAEMEAVFPHGRLHLSFPLRFLIVVHDSEHARAPTAIGTAAPVERIDRRDSRCAAFGAVDERAHPRRGARLRCPATTVL